MDDPNVGHEHSTCHEPTEMSCHSPSAAARIPGGITLSVNPEARIYASLTQPVVHRGVVGEPIEVPVGIQNDGYVTAPIEPTLLEPNDGSINLVWQIGHLSGETTETHAMKLVGNRPGFFDVTISFCLPMELPDLGGRDRIRLTIHTT